MVRVGAEEGLSDAIKTVWVEHLAAKFVALDPASWHDMYRARSSEVQQASSNIMRLQVILAQVVWRTRNPEPLHSKPKPYRAASMRHMHAVWQAMPVVSAAFIVFGFVSLLLHASSSRWFRGSLLLTRNAEFDAAWQTVMASVPAGFQAWLACGILAWTWHPCHSACKLHQLFLDFFNRIDCSFDC